MTALASLVTAPARARVRLVTTGRRRPPTTELAVLSDVSGVIRPGTLTLLLAPPGHGKSSFLKMVARRLPRVGVTGTVSYSGLAPGDAAAAGVHLGQLVQYVPQVDEHIPYLTVCALRAR